jgi:uncharacterized protein (DUF1800 family)
MSTAPTPTRRDVIKASAAVAGGLAVAGSLSAVAAAAEPEAGADFVPSDQELHLLRRATYGPTPASVATMRSQGRKTWLDKQLNPAAIDDSMCDHLIAQRFPGMKWTIPQARSNIEAFSVGLMYDVTSATISRAVWSKRQLLEVMCDFWSNHLNVSNPSDNVWDNRHDYDRVVIRKHALGRFEDMLVASAIHPAMLLYLNNAESTKDNPNENYGRELLELHSVSVDGGYNEEDMRQSTLIMTGFSVDWETGLFEYNSWAHHRGPVQVMGFSDDNAEANGYNVGIRYVKYLANHPSTAQHLAHKLCVRFVSDDPPQALVDSLAQTYLANGTAIKPMLRKLFLSNAFESSVGLKTRRPFEDVAATLRILGYKPDKTGTQGIEALNWVSSDLGNAPLAWSPPDGYPDEAIAWQSAGTTLGRWNMHLSLAAHWWPTALVQPPLRKLLPDRLPVTYGGLVDALAKRLVFRKLASNHRRAVLDFLGQDATDVLHSDDAAVGWRLPYLVALILDSPYHGIR